MKNALLNRTALIVGSWAQTKHIRHLAYQWTEKREPFIFFYKTYEYLYSLLKRNSDDMMKVW